MRSAFIGLVLTAASPALAETQTAQYGAVFCEDSLLLREFITQLLEHKPFDERPDRCEMLKPGLPVDVLRVLGELDVEHQVIAVRVHGSGGMVEGYTLSTNVEDAMPTRP